MPCGSGAEDESDASEGSYVLPFKPRRSSKRLGKRVALTDAEKDVEETLVSIRSRIRHNDPYDAWERQTRKDAFHVARAHHSQTLATLRSAVVTTRNVTEHSLSTSRAAERADLARRVTELEAKRQLEERRLREAWHDREKRLWDRVESSIKGEEERLRARLDAEKKTREAEERAKAVEEQKLKDEAARNQREAEARRLKEEEERKRKDEEKRIAQEQENARAQANAEQQEGQNLRSALGLLEARALWLSGLKSLKTLKSVTMRAVKGPKAPDPEPANYQPPPAPPVKKLWNAQRRKITPKVGQLTDDPREIARITEELKGIVAPIPNIPSADQQNLHHALLSSISKAVLSQAETEVTAHKAAARPLAQVIIALIAAYPLLGEIFWARMIGSIGVWAVGGIEPSLIEVDDATGERHELDGKEKLRRWGMRHDEPTDAYVSRVAGVLRLYFEMLFVETDGANFGNVQLQPQFRPARLWAYLAQLINHDGMLKRVVAPEAICVALDSAGLRALTMWGAQFVKILKVIYEGAENEKERWGGPEVVAQASRARCLLEVEKILSA